MDRNPLVQMIFSRQPQLLDGPTGWNLATEEVSNGSSKLDLIVVLDDRRDDIFGRITYNPDLFDVSTITRTVGHGQTLLAAVSVDAGKHITDLPILAEAETGVFPIQPTGSQPPLFLVRGRPLFLPLAHRLGSDQPLLGLHLPPTDATHLVCAV